MTAAVAVDLSGPVVVMFDDRDSAECRRLESTITELSQEHPTIRFIKLDLDDHLDAKLASHYGVDQPATVLVLQDKQECDRFVGALPKPRIVHHLSALAAF